MFATSEFSRRPVCHGVEGQVDEIAGGLIYEREAVLLLLDAFLLSHPFRDETAEWMGHQ
jgi:hypothetical protein